MHNISILHTWIETSTVLQHFLQYSSLQTAKFLLVQNEAIYYAFITEDTHKH